MSILHCLQAKLSPLKAEHARLLGIDGYLKIPGKASKLKEVKEHVLALIIHRMDLHSMPDGGPDLFDSGQKGVIRCLYICTLARAAIAASSSKLRLPQGDGELIKDIAEEVNKSMRLTASSPPPSPTTSGTRRRGCHQHQSRTATRPAIKENCDVDPERGERGQVQGRRAVKARASARGVGCDAGVGVR